MAYRAEIEIGVIGTGKLRSLRRDLDGLNNKLKEIDENAEIFEAPIRSIASFSRALQTAQQNLSLVELATDDEAKAIKDYVTALGASNDAVARQNQLIQQEVTLRNKAKKSIETRRKRDEFLAGPGRTIVAEKSAQRAAKESARRQREFAAIEAFNNKIRRIEANFNAGQDRIRRDADNEELQRLLTRLNLEEKKVKEIGKLKADIDNKALNDFDRRLRESSTLKGQSSPIGGAVNIPGSPAAKRRTANRQAITRGAGIGLATANIPGSNIAQAAAIGAGFGGPKGAAIAASVAAVSQAISGLVKLGPEAAKTEASLNKLGIALRGILGSQSAEGFKAIDRAARDFNQPIVDATRNFTQLSAAATANGNSVKQTETLYRALSAATKATGGDAEDLSGVLRAATQVISKGVVRSEELRGQIGDRLPGAFQLFAQATNRSAEELQKALEQGEVSADEFVTTFSNFILKKYEPAALRIGESPAEAGARLTKALEDANRAAGPLLQALGAKFQDFATKTIRFLTPLANYFNDLFNVTPATPAAFKKVGEELKDVGDKLRQAETRLSQATNEETRRAAREDIASLENRRQKVAKEFSRIALALPSRTEEAAPPLKDTTKDTDLKGAPRAPKLPTSKASQLQQQISQELLKQFDIKTKYMRLSMSESEALDFQNTRLRERLQREEILLESQRQQALATSKYAADADLINKLFDTRLVTLRGQTEEQIQQNLANKEQLAIQEKITQLKRQEDLEGLERGLRRDIADVERRTASPFGGDEAERAELLIKQTRRYDDIINKLNASIKEQEELERSKDAKVSEAATKQIAQLEQKIALNKILLPVLNEVEQAELRQKQLIEKYGFIADETATAMSSAVQSIITGTGSVEEAFSDMFANIGKAFVDMATQMIAKALIMKALGILANAFGGGGGGVGGGFNPGAPSITGNSLGDFGGGTPFAGAFRANGGPVSANQPYIVGERGPELLIPQTSGTVLSNEDSRTALARYKPGNSLLSEAGGDSTGTGVGRSQTLDPVINISTGPTLQFEGEGYVKQEDFKAGLARAAQEGAKQGQTLTLRKLMMSPTARSKIGI